MTTQDRAALIADMRHYLDNYMPGYVSELIGRAINMLEADTTLHKDCMNLGLENGELQDQIRALQKTNPPIAFYDISHDKDGEIEYLFSVYPQKGFKPLYTAAPQPAVQQEPVAIIRCWTKNGEGHSDLVDWCCPGIEGLPDGEHKLYAAPQPQRPRLTDEEILTLWAQTYVERGTSGIEFARAIEAKVRG